MTQVWLPDLLAKSAQMNEGREELLEEHTENVIAALAGLARRSPGLARLVGEPGLWHLAFWACVIHDFGKAAEGFQAILKGLAMKFGHRHEVLSLAFLPWITEPAEEELLALGIVSHHRDAPIIRELYDEGEDLPELIAQLSETAIVGLARWLEAVPNSWIDKYGFSTVGVRPKKLAIEPETFHNQALAAMSAGLETYRRTHERHSGGMYVEGYDEVETPREMQLMLVLRGLITQADRMASAHTPPAATVDLPDLEELTRRISQREGREVTPRAHQTAADQPGHLILTAPTGSGKTEAALAWAARQQLASGEPRRLIYVLPYQASLNAMQKRLEADLSLPDGVAIIHSRSLQLLYRNLSEAGADESPRELTRQARRRDDFNRLHQPAVAVMTPYQMLRGAYRLPGYEALFSMLAGSAIVLDEIHAYEPKRLGMFLALTRALVEVWGVRICAMTATMPSWLRAELEGTLGIKALPPDQALFEAARRHRLELLDYALEDDAALGMIAAEVKEGRSVLVAANTVRKAQNVWSSLRERLGEERTLLLHSRFTGDDRLRLETDLQRRLDARLGVNEPIAVIATQVIEVSLDLDFDRIYTEPAPLEALVQRFGRVNRRGRKGKNGLVPVTVLTQPRTGQRIYDDRLIERGLAELERAVSTGATVIDDLLVAQWLNNVYSGKLLTEWQHEVRAAAEAFEDSTLDSLRPFDSDRDLAQAFDRLFDGVQLLPKTKLASYLERYETSPIAARGLLVSSPFRVIAGLREFINWNDELKLYVADLEYDPILGLKLERPSTSPDEWDD